MTLLQTAVLALVLLSIAAVFWTSAAAFRDAPLLIVVAAALPAAMIAALFPDLRVLSLFVLTTGGVLAYLLSLGPLIDRANTSRVSAQDRDPAELTWLLIVTPLAVGLLNALLAFIPLPDVDAAAQLRSALNLGQLMLLISAAFAVRAAVHPTVVGRFAIRDCDLSHSQQIMRAALAVPPLFLILGACIWMGADLYGQSQPHPARGIPHRAVARRRHHGSRVPHRLAGGHTAAQARHTGARSHTANPPTVLAVIFGWTSTHTAPL
jgi:hypothetical protein